MKGIFLKKTHMFKHSYIGSNLKQQGGNEVSRGLKHYKSMTKQDKININQMAMEEGMEWENKME